MTSPVPSTGPNDLFAQTVRSSYSYWYTVDATLGGVPVPGVTGLRPVGGSITDTTKPGVRRTLSLEVAPPPEMTTSELYDALAPVGTLLSVTCHVRLVDQRVIPVPMGVFDIDSESMSEGAGGVSLTAPDKWVQIQRAKFLSPKASSMEFLTVVTQIQELIQDALGADEPVINNATSLQTVGPLVWEKDRAKAINEMAESIGAWVYFDRNGVATIADIPTLGTSADWVIDAAEGGVLVELDRERSRAETVNVWVVSSSASDGEKFPTTIVWDDDSSSPTYAGVDPLTAPETAGPFGIVVDHFDDPIIDNAGSAYYVGSTKLARSTGLASQVSLTAVPNPAIDAFHVIDVLPPREWPQTPRQPERHVVDTVTHPLTPGPQRISGRSTRAENFGGA